MADGNRSAGRGPSGTAGLWGAFAYFLGPFGAVLVLLSRRDAFPRFHAVQSILATVTLLIGGLFLRVLAYLPIFGFLYGILFRAYQFGIFLLWIFLMFKAWRGEMYRLPYIGEWASDPRDDVSPDDPST